RHTSSKRDWSSDVCSSDLENGPEPNWQEPAGRCAARIFAMRKPVIAALHGAATGAGITITLSADYRIATTDARFGFVFTRRGIRSEERRVGTECRDDGGAY